MSSNAGTYVAYGNNVFKQVNASMGQNFRVSGTVTFMTRNLAVQALLHGTVREEAQSSRQTAVQA